VTTGDFLFIHYDYRGERLEPTLTLYKPGGDAFEHFAPRGQNLTLSFDTSRRYCTGWHDLATSESFPCPNTAILPTQFDHCRHCQNKTGFNPAFYNATSVSPQQQARNATPHFLYLAHFAPGVVKVGISWADRGMRRLLDQGARSALIIKTYPTATIARQYEAKIAALPGIAETLQIKTKHKLMNQSYDPIASKTELLTTRERIIKEVGLTPDANHPLFLDQYYLADTPLSQPIVLHEPTISGRCLGMIGSTLIMEQDSQQFGRSLHDVTGYMLTLSNTVQANTFAPQQASLF
jgi:hypothetical protein